MGDVIRLRKKPQVDRSLENMINRFIVTGAPDDNLRKKLQDSYDAWKKEGRSNKHMESLVKNLKGGVLKKVGRRGGLLGVGAALGAAGLKAKQAYDKSKKEK